MYKTAENHFNHKIRKAKRDFYIKSLEQQIPNPCVIWNHIKSSMATTSMVQPRQTNSQLHPHANIMADKSNEHFANIALKFNTTTIIAPNYKKLGNFISRSKPENMSFELLNMTTEFVLANIASKKNVSDKSNRTL